MKNPKSHLIAAFGAAALVLGCASGPSPADVEKATADAVKSSFRAEGIATLDRLTQDDSNRECAAAEVAVSYTHLTLPTILRV